MDGCARGTAGADGVPGPDPPVSSCGSRALSHTCREGPALGSPVAPPPIQRHVVVRPRGPRTHCTHTPCSHACTLTLTFMRVYASSRTPSARLCTHVAPHTHVYAHACTLTRSCSCHTHAQSHILTSRRIDSHPHTPPHTDSHVDTSMYSNPHSHIHVHTHSCTHPCIHTALTFPYHTFACTPTLTFTRDPHTFTLMRTHVFADIHLHTPYILMFLFTLVLTDTGIRDMQTLAPHALLIHIHTH